MKKISSLQELESLSNNIAAASERALLQLQPVSNISLKPKVFMSMLMPGLGELADKASSSTPDTMQYNVVHDQTYKEMGIDREIEISPEMARFLANDHEVYNAKKQRVDDKDEKKWLLEKKMGAGALIAGFFGVDDFHTDLSLAANTLRRIDHHLNIKAEYERISHERNRIARSILESYQVTEPEPGKFVLKMGEWSDIPKAADSAIPAVIEQSITYSPIPRTAIKIVRMRTPIGFDASIDLSKLPDLPDSTPDLPTR